MSRSPRGAGTFLLALVLGAHGAHAASLCVNHGGTGGCFGTIFDALNAAAGGDTILIAGGAGPYFERLTIAKSLSLVGDSAATTIVDGGGSGQVIRILTAVTVTLANLTIRNGQAGEGNLLDQFGGGIHNINGTLTLNNAIVTGNHTGGGNGCCGGEGGGIYSASGNSAATLILNNSIISGNGTARPDDNLMTGGIGGSGGSGGGIYFSGTLTLNNSTVSNNTTGNGAAGGATGGSGGLGGGIFGMGTLTLNNSTVSNNTTGNGGNGGTQGGPGGIGGGIFFEAAGLATLNDSTVSGNLTGAGGLGGTNGSSGSGAGIYASGPNPVVTLNTSTVSGNKTGLGTAAANGDGGGIYVDRSTVNIAYSTLAFNQIDAGQAGGAVANNAGTVNIRDSLVAYNTTQQGSAFLHDCSGTITSLGYNVMTEPDCTITPTTGDQFYVRGTILGPLENNGGPTRTHALVAGSPAIDTADNSMCPSTDQRGDARPQFGGIALRCDVGAFEAQGPASFFTLPPCRLFDTRMGSGPDAAAPILAPGETRTLDVTGRCGVPSTAKALAVNLTVTGPGAAGFLVVFGGDLPLPPPTSNLNFTAGSTRANNDILRPAQDGSMKIKVTNSSSGASHFILDVNGYFQ